MDRSDCLPKGDKMAVICRETFSISQL